jgi:TP901 family phage tail tape measure protein
VATSGWSGYGGSIGLATGGSFVGTTLGRAVVMVGADTRQLASGLANAERMVAAFGAKTQATMAERITAIGKGVSNLGMFMTRTFTLAGAAIGIASARMAADYQASMHLILGLTNISASAIGKLNKGVMELAISTGVGPQKLADALYFIASSGIKNANQAMQILTLSAKAAAAGMGDVSTNADALTSVMNAYKNTALTAARAQDILTQAVVEGKGETDAIAKSIGSVIPTAVQLGVGFDEVAASIASATDVGLSAARAATGLRYALNDMLNPSAKAAEQLKAVFGSIDELHKELADPSKGFLYVLQKLHDGLSKADFNTAIGGIRGTILALTLVGKNSDQVAGIFDRISKPDGALAKAFGAQQHTTLFKFHQALATLEVDAIKLGNVLLPLATAIISKFSEWLVAFSKLNPEMVRHIAFWGAIVTLAGPVLVILGKLIQLGVSAFRTWSRINALFNSLFGIGGAVKTSTPMEIAAASMNEAAGSIELSANSMAASYERVAVAAQSSSTAQIVASQQAVAGVSAAVTEEEIVLAEEQAYLEAGRRAAFAKSQLSFLGPAGGVRTSLSRPASFSAGQMSLLEGGYMGSYPFTPLQGSTGGTFGRAAITAEDMMASVDRTMTGRIALMGVNARTALGDAFGSVGRSIASAGLTMGRAIATTLGNIFSPLNIMLGGAAFGIAEMQGINQFRSTLGEGVRRTIVPPGTGVTRPYVPGQLDLKYYLKLAQERAFGTGGQPQQPLSWFARTGGGITDFILGRPWGETANNIRQNQANAAAVNAAREANRRYQIQLQRNVNAGGYVYTPGMVGGQTPREYAQSTLGGMPAPGMQPWWSPLGRIPGTRTPAFHVPISQVRGALGADILTQNIGTPQQKGNVEGLEQQYFALTGSMKGVNIEAVKVWVESGRIDKAIQLLQHHVDLAGEAWLKHEKTVLTNKDAFSDWAQTIGQANQLMPKSKDNISSLINAIYKGGGVIKGNAAELLGAYIQTGKYDRANQLLVRQLYKVEIQSGKTKKEAKEYIAKLLDIPPKVVTELILGTAGASAAMDKWAQDQADKGRIISPPGAGVGRIKVARGGPIPGIGNTDSVPALLTPGEFVFTKRSVNAMGGPRVLMSMMKHAEKFQAGGPVEGMETLLPQIQSHYINFIQNLKELTELSAVFVKNPPMGGGTSFPGGGGIAGGWGAAGSPHANFYRAAVQQAWPGLRFGGMYNRRFIAGTHTWSQHAYGNAVDEMTPSLPYGDQVRNWVAERSALFSIAHLLWRVPGHFNHVHADFWPQGTGIPGGGAGMSHTMPRPPGGVHGFRGQWAGGYGEFSSPTMLPMMVGERGSEFVHVGALGPKRSVGFTHPNDLAAMEDVMTRSVEVGVERAMRRVLKDHKGPVLLDGYRVGVAHGISALRGGSR